jgi:hypothetical protein
MKRPSLTAALLALAALAAAGGGAWVAPALAEDVIILPGYIAGRVALDGFTANGLSISAVGGGFSCSKGSSGPTYSLTVNGGAWPYTVSATPTFTGISYPSAVQLGFADRVLTVAPGEVKTNDYAVHPGIVRFLITVEGDPWTLWEVGLTASAPAPPGGEITSTSLSAHGGSSPATIDLPVVPNSDIVVSGGISIDRKGYDLPVIPPLTLAAGQVVEIPVTIVHVVDPPPPPPDDDGGGGDPPPPGSLGTATGAVELRGAESVTRHRLFFGGTERPLAFAANPATYSLTMSPGDYGVNLMSDLPGATLVWPTRPLTSAQKTVTLTAGHTTVTDYILPAGTLAGTLSFRGTLANSQLYRLSLSLVGDAGGATAGGTAVVAIPSGASAFRLPLPAGPWMPSTFDLAGARRADGVTTDFSLAMTDYRWYRGEAPYDVGQPVWVTAGSTLIHNREYCMGEVDLRFLEADGTSLLSPQVWGSSSYADSTGRTLSYTTISGGVSGFNGEPPEVVLQGVPGRYTLNCSATTQDGTSVSFPPFAIDFECGVRKFRDVTGPLLTLTAPASGAVLPDPLVTVSGTALDETGISRVTVNGTDVSFTPFGEGAGRGAGFSGSILLAGGVNQLVTRAVDAQFNNSYDTREVDVDPWAPSVTADIAPLLANATSIPVTIRTADRGFGFAVEVTLGGELLFTGDGSASAATAVPLSWSSDLPISALGKTLTAVVTDRAGHVARKSWNLVLDAIPPTFTVSAPVEGVTWQTTAIIPVSVSASDGGGGVSLAISLDGAGLWSGSAPARGSTLSWSGRVGPLPPGDHLLSIRVSDACGNQTMTTRTIPVAAAALPPPPPPEPPPPPPEWFAAATVTLDPRSTGARGGMLTAYVKLPWKLTRTCSLARGSTAETSSGKRIAPLWVTYDRTGDRLILRFWKTSALMADPLFTFTGRYRDPARPGVWSNWQGSAGSR